MIVISRKQLVRGSSGCRHLVSVRGGGLGDEGLALFALEEATEGGVGEAAELGGRGDAEALEALVGRRQRGARGHLQGRRLRGGTRGAPLLGPV